MRSVQGQLLLKHLPRRISGRVSTAKRELLPAEERKTRKALVPAEQLKTKKALLPAEERKKRKALLPAKQRKKSRQEQALPKQELPIPEAVRHNQLY